MAIANKQNNINNSRTRNVLLNSIWGITGQVIIVLLGLINRKIFLGHLGAELLGVNSLFSDVLILFSFADLGFGNAIMFSMYKPIAEKNEKTIIGMLQFYKKIYRFVIMALIIISLAFVPFLGILKTDIPIEELRLYYLFFQVSNILEYLWSYRESYVIACQRERVLSIANILYNFLKNVAQVIILGVTSNFILYLVVGIIAVALKKFILNLYITRKYPITLLRKREELPKNEKKSVIHKSVALIVTKIGNLIINQTDSLIVSYMINVAQWGLASNYLMIKKSVFAVSDKVYSAVLPSFGNLVAEKDIEKEYSVLIKYDYLNAWVHTFFFVSLTCLSSTFIELFFGEFAKLSNSFVHIFFLASFIDGLRSPVSSLREASGLYEEDKWFTMIAALVNIITSIPLASIFGLSGVYIGTIFSMVVLHVCRTWYLFRGGRYPISTATYLVRVLKHVIVGIGILIIIEWINHFIFVIGIPLIPRFLVMCFTTVILMNLLWFILYRNNVTNKQIISYLKQKYENRKEKKENE